MRLRDIGVITDAILTYLFQSIAKTWRTIEPEELESERGKSEQPRRLERLCYRALAEGLISIAKVTELLQSNIEVVEEGWKGPRLENAVSHQ